MKSITLIFFLLTSKVIYSQNLILNPSCDEPIVSGNIPYWQEIIGNDWQPRCSNPNANCGSCYFFAGAGSVGELKQTIDISYDSIAIDFGSHFYYFSAYVRSFSQSPVDESNILIQFRNNSGVLISSYSFGPYIQTSIWQHIDSMLLTPVGARKVDIRLHSVRHSGTNNDGYYDNLFFGIPSAVTALSLKLYIQGYYNGSGLMAAVLMNESVGTNNVVTDSIDVELRNQCSPYNVVASTKTIMSTNGNALVTFSINPGSYYIVVRHRNAMETWSAFPIVFGTTSINYDFSTASNKAYGNNMIQLEPGIWAFYSGDVNNDENIDLLDESILETDIANFEFGYFATDINGDGNVDLLDSPTVENNTSNFIFSNHP